MFDKNWKTINNNYYFKTESETPILKKDEHHAEIIDISDGLVVDEQVLFSSDYGLDNYDLLWGNLKHYSKMNDNNVWNAFSRKKI